MSQDEQTRTVLELLSDPQNFYHVGLVYWVNTALRGVGAATTLSLLTQYVASITSQAEDPDVAIDDVLMIIRKEFEELMERKEIVKSEDSGLN